MLDLGEVAPMRVEVTLQSVSPICWGGYNRDLDPIGVRITSIRGTLRKWYRWYSASTMADDCNKDPWSDKGIINKIRLEESKVFGSVHGGAIKSSIRLYFDILNRKEVKLNQRSPFLGILMKERRSFYENLKFKLVAESNPLLSSDIMYEFVKALALSLIFGGFGYRSNRGYGSLKLVSYETFGKWDDQKARKILDLAKGASESQKPDEWVEKARTFLREIGVRRCNKFWKGQALSNSYLVVMNNYICENWESCLREAERRLRSAERALRIGPSEVDYRAFLGMPILDKTMRRKVSWKYRRASPLILSLAEGGGNYYIKGMLMLSGDYPEEREYKDHFKNIDIVHIFENIREKLYNNGKGFYIIEW